MPAKIVLGGDSIECYDFPLIPNRKWRERAKVPLQAQRDIAEQAQKAETGEQVAGLYNRYLDLVDSHIEEIFDLVLDFLPDQSQREHYRERATEPEVLEAFLILTRLAFSTGFFWALTGAALTSGSSDHQTGTNLPEANGESG